MNTKKFRLLSTDTRITLGTLRAVVANHTDLDDSIVVDIAVEDSEAEQAALSIALTYGRIEITDEVMTEEKLDRIWKGSAEYRTTDEYKADMAAHRAHHARLMAENAALAPTREARRQQLEDLIKANGWNDLTVAVKR